MEQIGDVAQRVTVNAWLMTASLSAIDALLIEVRAAKTARQKSRRPQSVVTGSGGRG